MSTFTDRLQAENYIINNLEPTEIYSVGVHKNFNNRFHDGQTSEQFCNSVLDTGLTMNRGERAGLTDTVYMMGSTDFYSKICDSLDELYTSVDNEVIIGGVIVAIPGSIQDLDGTDYFLGLYPDDLPFISKYEKRIGHVPIEQYTEKIERVPQEFIICSVGKVDGKTTIFYNDRYISNLSPEEQAKILSDIKAKGVNIKSVEDSKRFISLPAFGEDYNVSSKYLADSAAEYEERRQELLDFYGISDGPRL